MQHDIPNIPEKTPLRVVLTFIGGIIAFTVFGVGIWLLVQSYSNIQTTDDQRASKRLQYKHEVDTESRRLLETYGWVDQEQGLAHIPISEAVKKVVENYQDIPTAASAVPVPGSKAAEAAAQALLNRAGAESEESPSPEATEDPAAENDQGAEGSAAAPVQEPATVTDSVNPELLIPAESDNGQPVEGNEP